MVLPRAPLWGQCRDTMGTPEDTHEMGMPWGGDTLGTPQGHPGMGHLGDGDTVAAP